MTDAAIQVRDLGKRYRIGTREPYKTLRDAIARAAGAPARAIRSGLSSHPNVSAKPAHDEYIWALKNVSFDIEAGEAVGIIGPNGAGKTTLLRILSRITEPTEGSAAIRGRVGSLLEVGTGFHQELTGRENVYLNGAILGMTKKEIDEKFDEIVGFAEFERFIDTPVKRYSDGMRVRLGFAVAAHLEPEILLVDEVLAVGDLAFQRKCLGKMNDVVREGRTVLFVSHNLASIQALTRRAICLGGGRIVGAGTTDEAVKVYLALVEASTPPGAADLSTRRAKILRSVEVLQGNEVASVVRMGTPLSFRMKLSTSQPLRQPRVGFHIDSEQGIRVVSLNTLFDLPDLPSLVGDWTLTCDAGIMPLSHGKFYVKAALSDGPEDLDQIDQACKFEVVPDDVFGTGRVPASHQGLIYWPGKWKLEEASVSPRQS